MRETEVIQIIEENLQLQRTLGEQASPGELDKKWRELVVHEPKRFLNENLTIKKEALRNFRKNTVFIPDLPRRNPSRGDIMNIINGGRRGGLKLLREVLQILEKDDDGLSLLKKYPVSRVGNPHVFTYKGYSYTHRWAKHIHSLSVFRKVLGQELDPDFVALDIGSSYGIFPCLLKKEYPRSHHILVDFPEQLVLACYFLGMNFPQAKIATLKDIIQKESLDRNFMRQYDFILLPWFYYEKLQPRCTDIISNFASFGEMRRKWFDFYLNSEVFRNVQYTFLINRFQSAPTYDSDLTVLDYPLQDFENRHFNIWPYSYYTYDRQYLFFTRKVVFSSQYFEFIGKRT